MNNIRKIVAVLLSLSMLIVANLPVFAFSDTNESPQSDAIKVISALGIVKGYQDGTFKPEQLVTRAEFAKAIAVICHIGENNPAANWFAEFYGNQDDELTLVKPGNEQISHFEDVKSDYWAYDTINGVVDYGIMSGVSDTIFAPDTEITLLDALKTMVKLLGYEIKAENKGGYPAGYLDMANELKLLAGLNNNYSQALSRQELSRLIYNALDVELMQATSFGQTRDFTTKKGETMLTEMLKLRKIKGILTSNDISSLTGASKLNVGRVAIEDSVYFLTDKSKYVADLLGYEVEAYYTDDIDTEPTILYAGATKNNNTITIPAEKIKGFSNNRLEYFKGDNGWVQTADIVPGAAMIYNGMANNIYNSDTFMFDKGYITLISAGKNNYNTIIIKDYKNFVVGSLYARDYVIYNKIADADPSTDDGKLVLDPMDSLMRIKIVSDDGKPLEFDQIKVDSVLTVAKNGNNVEAIVCTKTVARATIDELKENEDDKILVSGGREYIISPEYFRAENTHTLSVGDIGTIYLDTFGRIAWYNKSVNEDVNTAYLIKSEIPHTGVDSKLQMQLFGIDGVVKIISVADKVTINDNQGNLGRYDKVQAANLLGANVGVIRYSLNGSGFVKSIELPLNSQNENDASHLYNLFKTTSTTTDDNYMQNFGFKTSTNTLGGKLYIDNSTIIISQPSDPLYAKGYSLVKLSSFQNDHNYELTAYGTVPNSPLAQIMVVKSIVSADINVSDLAVVVTRLSDGIDKDGERVVKVEGMQYNTKVELKADYNFTNSQGEECTALDVANDVFGTKIDANTLKTYSIKKGDIIKYSIDSLTGYIKRVQLLYQADAVNPINTNSIKGFVPGSSGLYSKTANNGNPFATDDSGKLLENATKFTQGSMHMTLGYVHAMFGNFITVTTQDLSINPYDKTNSDKSRITEYYAAGSFKMTTVEYRGNNVTVKTGSTSDIQTYKNAGSACSRVIVIMRYGDPTQLIIINGYKD